MRYGAHGSSKYKLLQSCPKFYCLAAEPVLLKDRLPVLLTVTMAISKTLVMPKDFLTLLIRNGTGRSQQADLWL